MPRLRDGDARLGTIAISRSCPGWTKAEIEGLEVGEFLKWLDAIAKFNEMQNAE